MKTIPVRDGRDAIVDDEDYERVSKLKWRFRRGYIIGTVRTDNPRCPRRVYLHKLILGAESGQMVDHRDRDVFNNRRNNLRFATPRQNVINCRTRPHSSRFRGVTWRRDCQKWEAGIRVEGRTLYLGVFADEASAARCYDDAAVRHHGEFACPNFAGDQS